MSGFVFVFLCAIYGSVWSTMNMNIASWQYWVILFCLVGAYICGAIRNK